MSTKYPGGAEWRKWDLHLHTPSSYDYADKSVTNTDIITTLLQNDIKVAAITDHHIIDVGMIKDLQEKGEKKGIAFLPGIEFLSDTRGEEPIHFIAIFSEACNLQYVWDQIKNTTEIRAIVGESKNINEIYCNLVKTTDIVYKLGGIVTIHAGSKSNTIENITHALPHSSAQKEDIAKVINIFEIGKEKDVVEYKNKIIRYLQQKHNITHPLIICSDNHNARAYTLKQNCWLKADPTFAGLKQVLNEPEDRVFIGAKPPILDRISNNRTKYIKQLKISHVDGYDYKYGKWFQNVTIPFNKELVAIIGHKGSGKSAIADIISLCANYYSNNDFSFLTSSKFREKSGRISNKFTATLDWESGYSDTKGLNDSPEDTNLKGVKYIPQGLFERLTNEISTASEFQSEIEKVVFSHVNESDKLGAVSFSELIEKIKSTLQTELNNLYTEIDTLNTNIIKLERKVTSAYKKEIENKLLQKEDELKALIEPTVVSDPNIDPEKKKLNEGIILNINNLKQEISEIEDQINQKEKDIGTITISLKNLKDVKKEVEIKATEIDRFIALKKDILSEFHLNFDKLISIKTDFTELNNLIIEQETLLSNTRLSIQNTEPEEKGKESLKSIVVIKKDKLVSEQAKLDTEQKKYQNYLNDKKSWEDEKNKIIGNESSPSTITGYKKELYYINNELEIELSEQYSNRKDIVRNIFSKKQEVIAIYKDIKSRLNDIIANNSDTLKEYKIDIAASLVKKPDFYSQFSSHINHGKMGTFFSKEGSEKKFLEYITDTNFDIVESVLFLLDNIVEALRYDKRDGHKNVERLISEQVGDIASLYNYLFKLEFIDYNYQLKQGDKGIEQLSPGERGALLLVFYLLLDNNDIPLIIDQPEDNLDNHSVAKILVPFIRAAKSRRQIIMVTHNPNLAVVSDAEQVIYVELNKDDNYSFSTITGSIEDRDTNNKIVEVLEGAMPAFNKRKMKYYV